MTPDNFRRISQRIPLRTFIEEQVGYVIGGYENCIEDYGEESKEGQGALEALNDFDRIYDECVTAIAESLEKPELNEKILGMIKDYVTEMLDDCVYSDFLSIKVK